VDALTLDHAPPKRSLFSISPINRRRWQNYKRNRRGYWAMWLFAVLFFISLFADTAPGISFSRPTRHLLCAPTNVQAEVLVPDPIPLDSIMAIAVADEEQAKREICRATLQGLSVDKDILVVPDFYRTTRLARTIQSGNRVSEISFDSGGRHGQ
jgi:hypothetical protein